MTTPTLPLRFGKYLLLERMHVGGVAEVFLAKALGVEGFERLVAVKKILAAMAADEDFISQFQDEARISIQLSHANIVHLIEFGRHDEAFYLAMEYLSGRDLRHVMDLYAQRGESMPVPQAVFIASKICDGLDYAHRRKDARGQDLDIIHRGISPQNILVSYEGEVKIIDFGMAKAANRSQKTQAGILKGKAGYMSPEQVRGEPMDRRSDIFAVGVLLYEALAGRKLFIADSDFATMENVAKAEVPPLRDLNPYVPDALETVLIRALAREPAERYEWASDLQQDLMRFLVSDESMYSGQQLSRFMREAFADELQLETQKLERLAQLAPPEESKRQKTGMAKAAPRITAPKMPKVEATSDKTEIADRTVVQRAPEPPSDDEGNFDRTVVVSLDTAAAAPPPVAEPHRKTSTTQARKSGSREAVTRPGTSATARPPPVGRKPTPPAPMAARATTAPETGKLPSNPQMPRVTTTPGAPAFVPKQPSAVDQNKQKVAARRRKLIYGASAAFGLVCVIALALMSFKGSDRGTGILVRVQPAVKATVTVGGRLVTGERVVRFPPGEYDLVAVAPGYKVHSQRITIWKDDPDAVFTVLLEPEEKQAARDPKPEPPPRPVDPPKPATFAAKFLSAESGVEISVDGALIGRTPEAVATGLALGKHHFTAKLTGYRVAEGEFSSDQSTELNVPVVLEKEREQRVVSTSSRHNSNSARNKRGRLVCTSNPDGAEVFIDGKPTGRRTPISTANPLELAPGRHKVQFRVAGLESAPQTVEIHENESVSLKDVAIDRDADIF